MVVVYRQLSNKIFLNIHEILHHNLHVRVVKKLTDGRNLNEGTVKTTDARKNEDQSWCVGA